MRRLAIVMLVGLAGCAQQTYATPAHISPKLVPESFGMLVFKREPSAEKVFAKAGPNSLVSEGHVYSLRHDDLVEGSLQVALYKPTTNATDKRVLRGIERTIAEGTFDLRTVHGESVYIMRLQDQDIYLWFPPRQNTECLLVTRKKFKGSDRLMRALIEYQQGRVPIPVPLPSPDVVVIAPAAANPAPAATPATSPSAAVSSPSPR